MGKLLPTIRYDVKFESDRLRELDLAAHFRIRQGAEAVEENTLPAWPSSWTLPADTAREIAATDYLFVD